MTTRQNQAKARLLKELRLTPIVQIACKKASVSRATYYRWRNDDFEFQQEADSSIEMSTGIINDLAESKLISKINDGDFQAMTFWLKYRHKAYKRQLENEDPQQMTWVDLIKKAGLRDKQRQLQENPEDSKDFIDISEDQINSD